MAVTPISSALSPDQNRYAVESGIPIAPRKAIGMGYPFLSMKIGDSFALRTDTYRECVNVRGAIQHWNKTHAPMKFGLRMDRATGKYRCWRLA